MTNVKFHDTHKSSRKENQSSTPKTKLSMSSQRESSSGRVEEQMPTLAAAEDNAVCWRAGGTKLLDQNHTRGMINLDSALEMSPSTAPYDKPPVRDRDVEGKKTGLRSPAFQRAKGKGRCLVRDDTAWPWDISQRIIVRGIIPNRLKDTHRELGNQRQLTGCRTSLGRALPTTTVTPNLFSTWATLLLRCSTITI